MTDVQKYPIPSAAREDLEETLGLVWQKREEGVTDAAVLRQLMTESVGGDACAQALSGGYLRENGPRLELTATGEALGADVSRRHRLAERLLTDVLSLDRGAVDPNACRLEHIISPEVSESICTLLGHPKECPHGHAIPPGPCCARVEKHLEPIVVPLSRLRPGDRGTVAYLQLREHPELHRLLSLGLIPGAAVHLHQTYPAFVVDLGESQLALEESVADRIYVRRSLDL